ncbi:MAG: ATP-dependent RNA helicase HrpA [Porticoccaceae bacterium]|nr:ATP-dependent RNA helicase HrpA [Porticoccaceae bacterium]
MPSLTSDSKLSRDWSDCLIADRHGFERRWRSIAARQRQGKPVDKSLAQLEEAVQLSREKVAQRRAGVPVIHYPDDLPIAQKRDAIIAALEQSQVVVVAGETGSGKTTQLPKICLELGRGITGMIGHTQPRRIAARTVAQRIADELNTPLGDKVGYQVRFTEQVGDDTHIKLMTDGILLAEIQHDRYLSRYDTLIIDEAHERSLNIDFLLGYLKQLLPKRPDLKVIITSATIDVERFSRHFDDAPMVEVSGRTYPVEVLYRPPLEADEDLYGAIVDAVHEVLTLPKRGDILIFLSGEREIRETANQLRRAELRDVEVLPLYARLSLKDQTRVFQPHRGTRIILATNVAETSITVPGIRYVIDTGLARISRYSYRTKVQRLPVEPISQASANQRAGRCGRVSDGVCVRLYSEEDFQARPAFTDPEIVRTNLASVILRMLQLRIGDVRDFPFVDAPDSRLINDGFQLLSELGAVDPKGELTALGVQLTGLPVDPRLGRMLVAADREGSLRETLVIVSALSLQDPRERPADKRQAADEKHRQWHHKESDFLALVNLWNHFEEKRQELGRNPFSRYCHANFVSYLRMREWRDLEHQLRLACRQLGLTENREPAGYNAIHRALLTGLLGHVGFRHDEREFLGARNRKFHVFPGSGLVKKPPKWLMAAELIETSRLYAHQVARIEPEWLVELAAHLVRKNHSEPHYDVRRGQVMAFEKQTLFGLTILDRKRVPFATIDPVLAREVFIRGALVADTENDRRYRGKGEFARHNRQLLKELEDLEERLRRGDLAVDEQVLYAFYDERVAGHVVSLTAFETWRKQAERDNSRLLWLDRESLVSGADLSRAESQFPKELSWQDVVYRLSYRFEPGHHNDGVTVHIPAPLIHQVPAHRFEWLVPGLLRDKCIALVKALPKQLRKLFVPVPDYVDRALAGLVPDNRPLGECLGEQLKRHTGITVPAEAWDEAGLDSFYRITYRLEDERGQLVEQGKDLAALKSAHRETVQSAIRAGSGSIDEQRGLSRWSFGSLPSKARVKKGKLEIDAFPALVDEGDSVALTLYDNAAEAASATVHGLVRLLMLNHPDPARYLRKQLLKGRELASLAAGIDDLQQMREDIITSAYRKACLNGGPLPASEAEFTACLAAGKGRIVNEAQQLEAVVINLLEPLKTVHSLLGSLGKRYAVSTADVQRQLDNLLRPGFLFDTSSVWLQHYPRYLKALVARLEKLPGYPDRDAEIVAETQAMTRAINSALQTVIADSEDALDEHCRAEIEKYRFMIEEYRVSCFAQVLKTVVPVSPKRIAAQLARIKDLLP